MPVIKGLSVAVLGSLLLAIGVSLLPALQLQSTENAENIEAFSEEKNFYQNQTTVYLDENNLVDFLVQIPVKHQWEQVSLKRDKLSIDVALTSEHLSTSEEIYNSLYHIVQAVLGKTRNVQELLVRVKVESSPGPTLVLASLVASREDLKRNPEFKNHNEVDLNLYLSTHFDFSKTSTWYEFFPPKEEP